MKATKSVKVLAKKLYEIGLEARYRFEDSSEVRPTWSGITEPHRRAWYAIAEYIIRLIGSEEKGK